MEAKQWFLSGIAAGAYVLLALVSALVFAATVHAAALSVPVDDDVSQLLAQ